VDALSSKNGVCALLVAIVLVSVAWPPGEKTIANFDPQVAGASGGFLALIQM
jgi:hypothetical protein